MSRPNHFREVAPTIQRGDIAAMYRSRDTDPLCALDPLYQPPQIFEHGRKTLVALVPSEGAQGCTNARVFEIRTPDAIYLVETEHWRMTTRMSQLAIDFALATANGEIRVEHMPPPATYPDGEDPAFLEDRN